MPRDPKTAQEGPNTAQNTKKAKFPLFLTFFWLPEGPPRGPQEAPGGPKKAVFQNIRVFSYFCKNGLFHPPAGQEAPKTAQEADPAAKKAQNTVGLFKI